MSADSAAQYSLAGLYYRGQGVTQNYETAFELYRRSTDQGNPYADYELAKMFWDGIGTQKDTDKAGEHFKCAFTGFSSLEAESHDDKLQYRLGQMLYSGTGTPMDILATMTYFEKAAKVGNVNAQYMLGKLWLETGTGDPEQAIEWLIKATDGGNAAAQYVPLPSSIVTAPMCKRIFKKQWSCSLYQQSRKTSMPPISLAGIISPVKISQRMRQLRSNGSLFLPVLAISTLNTPWRSCTSSERMLRKTFKTQSSCLLYQQNRK